MSEIRSDYQEYQFFMNGFKPAIIPHAHISGGRHIEKLLIRGNFPSCESLWNRSTIYFQNENLRDQFIKHQKLMVNTMESQALMGITLGYPPTAASVFAVTHCTNKESHVYVNFYGLQFATDKDWLEDNLSWLRETYQLLNNYPGDVRIETSMGVIKINIEDYKPEISQQSKTITEYLLNR